MAKPVKIEKRTRRYVDEVYHKLLEQPGVKDVIILNQSANPVRTTMEQSLAVEYCGYYEMLYQKVLYFLQQIDEEDELLGLRVRTKYDETLVTKDGKITVMVVQNAQDMALFQDIIRKNEAVIERIIEKSRGYIVINNRNGNAMATTVENTVTLSIMRQISGPLVSSARSAIRDLDVTNDLTFMRIATKKMEFLVAPEDEFTIVVIH